MCVFHSEGNLISEDTQTLLIPAQKHNRKRPRNLLLPVPGRGLHTQATTALSQPFTRPSGHIFGDSSAASAELLLPYSRGRPLGVSRWVPVRLIRFQLRLQNNCAPF